MSDEEFLCSCRDNGGQYVSTSQDLNICLANRGGSLVVRLPWISSSLSHCNDYDMMF
jgi:hypothetical protein